MADYAKWGEAVGRGLGWGHENFISTYTDNRLEATRTELEESPIGTILLTAARVMPRWSGSPAALLSRLNTLVNKKVAASARWPKTSHTLGNELRRIAPQLRLHGLLIRFERRHDGRIVILESEGGPIVPSTGGAQNSSAS